RCTSVTAPAAPVARVRPAWLTRCRAIARYTTPSTNVSASGSLGSDYDALIEDCGPALWIHGHVHESFDYRIGRTAIACNPRGYLRCGENARFDPTRSVKLQYDGRTDAARA
ncbi:MAG: hypothetical protein OEW57_15985, partial [Gammaproteobacteria bacterium]|nr:hypothetical protein [Gammaproteobacteria bacterium]